MKGSLAAACQLGQAACFVLFQDCSKTIFCVSNDYYQTVAKTCNISTGKILTEMSNNI